MPTQELVEWKHHARVAGVPLAAWVRHHVRLSLEESKMKEVLRQLREWIAQAEDGGRSIKGWNFTHEEEGILRGATRSEVGDAVVSTLIVDGPRKAFERIYGIPVLEWRSTHRGYQA